MAIPSQANTGNEKLRHVLKLLAIIITVFFAGLIFNRFIEELPGYTIPVRDSIEILSDFFPVFVSFSIFSVTWFAFDKSRDNHSLFMGMIFIVIGLIDLCHTLSYPFMPDFITPNSLQKVAVLHGEARLISAILFLASAYIDKDTFPELINKPVMFAFASILFIISLISALFYLDRLPLLYRDSSRSTTLIIRQLITTVLMLYASYLYTRKLQETGQKHFIPLIYGFIILIFSDLIYFEYELSGHLLKLTGFIFMYLALYKSSVELPYEKLAVAEQKLRHAAEEKYRSLVQTANDAIISEDSNGNIISWNRGAQSIFGYTEEEVLDKPLTILMPERYIEAYRAGFERLSSTGESEYLGKTLEFYGQRKDGTEFPLELSVTEWRTEEGIFFTGIVRDITERNMAEEALRRARDELELRVQERTAELAEANETLKAGIAERKRVEVALRESEAKYRSIFENAAEGIYKSTPAGRFIEVNPALARMLGYTSPQELLYEITDIRKFFVDQSRKEEFIRLMLTYGTVSGFENKLRRKDGSVIWILMNIRALHDSSGNVTGFEGMIVDITERKRVEEERERWMAELARSNAELEQFAYIASHDLQEPLRMISGFTQLLAKRYKGRLDKDADEFIAYIVDGTTRMQQMINDLLAYSRVGTRGKPFEPTDLEDVFEKAVTYLKVAIEQNGATVTHDPLPAVMADDIQMVQLLQNLISNAIKFRREEPPRVHVSAKQRENDWTFSVKDNGIGIAPEFMGRLFQLFAREHTSDKYPGTGIGLAICRRIVERHGGRIWAESEVGKGSIFYFTIPVRKS